MSLFGFRGKKVINGPPISVKSAWGVGEPHCHLCNYHPALVFMGVIPADKFSGKKERAVSYCRSCLYHWVMNKIAQQDFDGIVLVS